MFVHYGASYPNGTSGEGHISFTLTGKLNSDSIVDIKNFISERNERDG